MGLTPGMQLPNTPEKWGRKKQTVKASLHLLKSKRKTKQSLIDRATGRHTGNIKEEVVTIMALIGCYHMTDRSISRLQPCAEAGYK